MALDLRRWIQGLGSRALDLRPWIQPLPWIQGFGFMSAGPRIQGLESSNGLRSRADIAFDYQVVVY